MEKRIVIAGSGGQGVLFLGKLIAYSCMLEGKEVACFPSYGAEMRGGTANCTVIISDGMIGSPVIRNPDILAVMNEASFNRFIDRLLPEGLLIYDSSIFNAKKQRKDIRTVNVPASKLASSFNGTNAANMAIIGALVAASGILDIKSALNAIAEITPAHRKASLEVNRNIIMKGFNSVSNSPAEQQR